MNEIQAIFERFLTHPIQETLSIIVPEKGELPIVSTAPFQTIGAHEIRVMMVTMGYCGRDKSIVTGQKTAVPGRIGHEGTGIVIEKGSQVDTVEIGQKVIIFPFLDHHNIGYDWPTGGKGIFSDFPTIPQDAVYPVSKDDLTIRDWLALSLVEPFSGVLRGLKRANITQKNAVIILGAGPIGCAHAILAKYYNPAMNVTLVDRSQEKLEVAKSRTVPADDFIMSSDIEGLRQIINQITVGKNAPVIIHANPYKSSLKQAITMSPDQGTVLVFSGIYDWNDDDNSDLGNHVAIDPRAIHYEEYDSDNPVMVQLEGKAVTLIGSRGYARDDFHDSADLIVNRAIDPLPLVTRILKFDDTILSNLKREGSNDRNIKMLMSPYDIIVKQSVENLTARVMGVASLQGVVL